MLSAAAPRPKQPVKPPLSFSLGKPEELKIAIQRKFMFEGEMHLKHLYTAQDIGRFRVNWFIDSDNGRFIHQSKFVEVKRVNEILEVTDLTVTKALILI